MACGGLTRETDAASSAICFLAAGCIAKETFSVPIGGENTGSEQWEMIIPHENHQCLSRISLGQMIGSEKYK